MTASAPAPDYRNDPVYVALVAAAEDVERHAKALLRKRPDGTTQQIMAGAIEGAARIVRDRAHARLIEITAPRARQ